MKFSNRLMARVVGHGLLTLNYRLSTGYCHIRVRCGNDPGNPAPVFAGKHLYGSVAGNPVRYLTRVLGNRNRASITLCD